MTMFPAISILSGLYTIVRQLGFFGTGLSLLVTYPVFTLPFTSMGLDQLFLWLACGARIVLGRILRAGANPRDHGGAVKG